MGPFTVPLRSCLIVLACLALVVGTALPEVRAQGVDSPLVGKWEGNWVNLSHPNARGEYTMTVTKVEGDKVYAHIEKAGFPSGSSGSDIVGTLEGDKLTYGTSSTSTELTLSGKQLRGISNDNFRLAVEMTKSK
jgi:hypothetical protein